MKSPTPFEDRFESRALQLTPSERKVVDYFRTNREETLIASAADLADKIGTSDATVVRTARALGYSGLGALRRDIASSLRDDLSPAGRLTRTLAEIGDDLEGAFASTVALHLTGIDRLRHDISASLYRNVVRKLAAAPRVIVFGIGPSSALASYCAIELNRFGIPAETLVDTGSLLADGLHRLRRGDVVVALAYSRVYVEFEALIDQTTRLKLTTILLTDTLGALLRNRVRYVLPVARGRADMLSLHTATFGLIEALLVGVAAQRRDRTFAALERFGELRKKLGDAGRRPQRVCDGDNRNSSG